VPRQGCQAACAVPKGTLPTGRGTEEAEPGTGTRGQAPQLAWGTLKAATAIYWIA